jgi:DNA-binding MarR family transcriptional regulator
MKLIGYWLNRTDRALTTYMDGMLAEFGLARITWRVLNVIADATETADDHVLSLLAAGADASTLTAAIDTALADGWAARPAPGRLRLTADGRARLAEVAERVQRFRDLSTTGISPDEYRTAVSVLERMTLNLEGRAMGHQ